MDIQCTRNCYIPNHQGAMLLCTRYLNDDILYVSTFMHLMFFLFSWQYHCVDCNDK